MTDLLQHELQNPHGENLTLTDIVGDQPTLFVLLRHFG